MTPVYQYIERMTQEASARSEGRVPVTAIILVGLDDASAQALSSGTPATIEGVEYALIDANAFSPAVSRHPVQGWKAVLVPKSA